MPNATKKSQVRPSDETGLADPEDAKDDNSSEVHDIQAPKKERCGEFLAAYKFTCGSVENYCRCCCPHARHVPVALYLVPLVGVAVGLVVALIVGIVCHVRTLANDCLNCAVWFDLLRVRVR